MSEKLSVHKLSSHRSTNTSAYRPAHVYLHTCLPACTPNYRHMDMHASVHKACTHICTPAGLAARVTGAAVIGAAVTGAVVTASYLAAVIATVGAMVAGGNVGGAGRAGGGGGGGDAAPHVCWAYAGYALDMCWACAGHVSDSMRRASRKHCQHALGTSQRAERGMAKNIDRVGQHSRVRRGGCRPHHMSVSALGALPCVGYTIVFHGSSVTAPMKYCPFASASHVLPVWMWMPHELAFAPAPVLHNGSTPARE